MKLYLDRCHHFLKHSEPDSPKQLFGWWNSPLPPRSAGMNAKTLSTSRSVSAKTGAKRGTAPGFI